MRISLFLALLSGFSVFAQDFAPPPDVKLPDTSPRIVFEITETCGCGQETHYAGGLVALHSFIKKNISFPYDMNWRNTEHVQTYVQFIVERDGSLSDVHVIRTDFPEANEYILAAFGKMKNWIAGEVNCVPARTRMRIPISLVLK